MFHQKYSIMLRNVTALKAFVFKYCTAPLIHVLLYIYIYLFIVKYIQSSKCNGFHCSTTANTHLFTTVNLTQK
jgi:hypothetical protein